MIPQRVRMRGFLCYKDEQEVAFDGSDLWMLAGLNGSGKSSVFDAVTYALFGHHRGGSQSAVELINKDCDKAAVEFEFTLGDQRIVAHRTIQRTKTGSTKSSQQLYICQPGGTREPIDQTHLKAGYEEWIANNIGLSFDVFTSSIMLRQGEAEKLLDAGPAGRHKVLAGIVDLERYERLHERARAELKRTEGSTENLQLRLADMLEVTPLELAAADSAIEEAELARQRWEQARKLLDDAATIEKDVQRLAELRAVLPRVQTAIEQHGQILTSEAESQELEKGRQQLDEQVSLTDNTLGQTQRKIASLRNLIAADEQRHRDVAAAFRAAGAAVEKLKEFER